MAGPASRMPPVRDYQNLHHPDMFSRASPANQTLSVLCPRSTHSIGPTSVAISPIAGAILLHSSTHPLPFPSRLPVRIARQMLGSSFGPSPHGGYHANVTYHVWSSMEKLGGTHAFVGVASTSRCRFGITRYHDWAVSASSELFEHGSRCQAQMTKLRILRIVVVLPQRRCPRRLPTSPLDLLAPRFNFEADRTWRRVEAEDLMNRPSLRKNLDCATCLPRCWQNPSPRRRRRVKSLGERSRERRRSSRRRLTFN